ncbi:lambda-exonuclease family protein ['Cynodon dactylon' phytoplasma]|uniref:lambda-exonuclease family protein n=1 Tax='Cynodon dactylon' phytoplasma TaxID=295320 RepID=UPI001265D4FC|nr:endonuclease ['Cynodon dactylon' phytoplasma]KAB8121732.1 endonuclease ['Cynodon dactylon' phytoplasma]
MKTDLKPNSYEWLEYQKKYINENEIEIIMGINNSISVKDLIKKKILDNHLFLNKDSETEKKTKLHANLFFNILKKRNYEPAVFIKKPFLVSLDGYHSESKTMLEIKCPSKLKDILLWKEFSKNNKIPIYHFCRIQYKIYCSESLKAYFLVYFEEQKYFLKEIRLDTKFIKKMIEETDKYKEIFAKYEKILKN